MIYKYFSSLPKAQLRAFVVVPIVAKCFPSGVIIKTPPGPVENTTPDEWTLSPSNQP